jgi:hypothetical protein
MFIRNVGVNLQHCTMSRLVTEVRKPNDVLFLLQIYEQNLDALKRMSEIMDTLEVKEEDKPT